MSTLLKLLSKDVSSKIIELTNTGIVYSIICTLYLLARRCYITIEKTEDFTSLFYSFLAYGFEVYIIAAIAVYKYSSIILSVFKCIAVVFLSFITSLQILVESISGSYLTSEMIDNLDQTQDAQNIYPNPYILYFLIFLLIISYILTLHIKKSILRLQITIKSSTFTYRMLSLCILIIMCFQSTNMIYDNMHNASVILGPVTSFGSLASRLVLNNYIINIQENQIKGQENNRKYPLEHNLHDQNYPDRIKERLRSPNILMIFIEGTSADMIGAYSSKIKLTPCLDDFATKSVVFDDYFNHTAATIRGIPGQLTSTYSRLKPAARTRNDKWLEVNLENHTWVNETLERKKLIAQRDSLSSILKIASDDTYITSVIHPEAENQVLDNILHTLDFDHVYNRERLETFIKASKSDRWQRDWVKDEYIFEFAQKILNEELDRPKLVVVYTIGTHAFGEPSSTKANYTTERNITRRIESIDYDLCNFLNNLNGRDFFQNNIVVVTTDHALWPEPEYIELKKSLGEDNPKFVARVPLIIRTPNLHAGRRSVLGRNSLDLVPTILDLIETKNVPVSFIGKSLFELDPIDSYYVSAIGDDFYITNGGGLVKIQTLSERRVKDKLEKWVRWVYELENQNRIAPRRM